MTSWENTINKQQLVGQLFLLMMVQQEEQMTLLLLKTIH